MSEENFTQAWLSRPYLPESILKYAPNGMYIALINQMVLFALPATQEQATELMALTDDKKATYHFINRCAELSPVIPTVLAQIFVRDMVATVWDQGLRPWPWIKK